MPRQITQYRVFIGSPGGLDDERRAFEKRLGICSKSHGAHRDVHFEPVGWEDTLGGVGRPQGLINDDLEGCDYAVFVFHDRWGSPTGKDGKVGTQEEWDLAEKLYEAGKIRNIVLFFKAVDPGKAADPGDQLKPVLAFRKTIVEGKRHLFHDFATLDDFRDHIDRHLARWLDDHDKKGRFSLVGALDGGATPSLAKASAEPGFAFWLAEARGQDAPAVRLHFAERAATLAATDLEWADARNAWGVAKFELGHFDDALAAFREVSARFSASRGGEERFRGARALVNEGATLGALGRSEDAITVYDQVVERFASASEPAILVQIAKALVHKGVTLGALGRSEDAIVVYDQVVARFASASEPAILECVAKALFNKGVTLGALGRSEDAIAVFDQVVARFASASEPAILEKVAMALVNKGVRLGALGRSEDEIAVYDQVVARFASASEPAILEQVANALFNEGVTLSALGRSEDAIAVYDQVVERFADASEPTILENVAKALFNKGVTLGALGRSEDAIAVYDRVVARFSSANQPAILQCAAEALFNKGVTLGALGRSEDALAVFDQVVARFADAPALAALVDRAKAAKSRLEGARSPKKKSPRKKP